MALGIEIYTLLHDDSTVEGLVDTRIFPQVARQKESRPHIVWTAITADREQTLTAPVGLVTYNVQFDCISATYDGAVTLVDAVRKAIDGYSGTPSATEILEITVTNEMDMPSADGTEVTERYGKILEAEISIRETPNNET